MTEEQHSPPPPPKGDTYTPNPPITGLIKSLTILVNELANLAVLAREELERQIEQDRRRD